MSEKTEETKKPSTDELIAQLLKAQEENKNAINMLAKAIVEVNKKVEAQPKTQTQTGSSDPLTAVLSLIKPQEGSMESLAKQVESFARVADALEHYRRPTLPYSPADRFLMRAGATAVRRVVYEGVKGRTEKQLSDKELDKILFGEEEGETEHVSE